jgi:hypothetical protein
MARFGELFYAVQIFGSELRHAGTRCQPHSPARRERVEQVKEKGKYLCTI